GAELRPRPRARPLSPRRGVRARRRFRAPGLHRPRGRRRPRAHGGIPGGPRRARRGRCPSDGAGGDGASEPRDDPSVLRRQREDVRIVQSYMLYREQVAEAQFVSIEEYLGRNTSAYYDILARTGRGRWSPERSAAEWVEFALTAHYRQARTVQGRLWSADRVAERVDDLVGGGLAPERATPALELTFSGWGLRNATYRELAEVTATTA